jgi:hypothetical protein
VRRAIPASRLNILNTQWQEWWRVIPQGVVQSHELKRQRKRPQRRWSGKRRYPTREYNRKKRGNFRICKTYGIGRWQADR